MDKDELEEYVERANAIAEDAPQMGEANTKEMLVRPFLEVLGWEFHPSEVKLEYPVRMASTRTKVDYALMLNEAPAVFVEAKGLDTELSEDHKEQVTSYMHNEESVEWGLLTNGEEYEFFMYDGSPSGFSLGKFELTELPKNTEVAGTLSKNSVSSGESEDRAKRLRERRRAVSTLREDKDEIAEDVTDTVTAHVGDSVGPVAETEAKEFVDRVVEELENGEVMTSERKKAKQDEDVTERASDEEGAVSDTLSRNEIDGDDDAKVAIFPTKESGIEFLRENNAWGFVRVGDEPEYVGMYVASPEQQIRFFAKVDEIIPANEANLAKPTEEYTDKAKFDPDKKVINFKQSSLYQIENPIEYDGYTPQSLVYTSLKKFKEADSTSDLR